MRNELPRLFVTFSPSPNLATDQGLHLGAGMELTTAQLYSGMHTDDLRATILYLRTVYPDAPLLGIGFSLGANVLTLYAEQEGDKCCLRSGASLGCVSLYLLHPFQNEV